MALAMTPLHTPSPAGNNTPGTTPTPPVAPHHLDITAKAFLWMGRGVALALLLLSGAFFVEHIREWYMGATQSVPPVWVGVGVFLHLGMLIGLAICLRWTAFGSAVVAVTTLAFIVETGIFTGYFPFIVLYTLAPLICFAIWWKLNKTAGVLHLT